MLYVYDSKALIFKKISLKKYSYLFALVAFLFTGFGFTTAFKLNMFFERIPVIIERDKEVFSEEWLVSYLKETNAQHPEILLAQARHETGNFTSNIFRNNKNLFGMKKAHQRQTVCSGEEFGHAKYDSYEQSVIDMLLWQSSYAKNLTQNQYLQLLGELYAEDSFYLQKIKIQLK